MIMIIMIIINLPARGSEAECQHRFCPYCCYQLHPLPGAPAAALGGGEGDEDPKTLKP